jgi:hypothetical protein
MWTNTSVQLPKVGRDVIFTIPSENDENSTAYNGRNIDVGWLDNGEDNGGHCFVGRSFGYDQDLIGKWRYVPDLNEFSDLNLDDIMFDTPLLIYNPHLTKSDSAYRIVEFSKDYERDEIVFELMGDVGADQANDEFCIKLEEVAKFMPLSRLI